jgi:hypothetical protein
MALADLFTSRWLGVPYTPCPEAREFEQRAQIQKDGEHVVRIAVLDDRESEG